MKCPQLRLVVKDNETKFNNKNILLIICLMCYSNLQPAAILQVISNTKSKLGIMWTWSFASIIPVSNNLETCLCQGHVQPDSNYAWQELCMLDTSFKITLSFPLTITNTLKIWKYTQGSSAFITYNVLKLIIESKWAKIKLTSSKNNTLTNWN